MTGRTYKRIGRGGTTWSVMVEAGRDEVGARVRQSKHGFATKREADHCRLEMLRELRERLPVHQVDQTVDSLLRRWFEQHAAELCAPKTVERYRQLAGYLSSEVLNAPLSKVTALQLEIEYSRLHKTGGKDGAPLSAKTVRHVAGVVHAALRRAVRWGLLRQNPADNCELPKLERTEAKALDGSETQRLLAFAQGQWIYPILSLAVATGCRRGELLALTWADIDIAGRAVMICKSLEQTKEGLRVKSTKNTKARAIPLAPSSVELLRQHRTAQDALRADFEDDYRADLNLVFAAPDGNYFKPDSVTATACLLARKAGLKGIGLHSLRHSHGSQLLSIGVSLPVVSRRLGHADPAITARVYSHAFGKDEVAAADAWDAAMSKQTSVPKTVN